MVGNGVRKFIYKRMGVECIGFLSSFYCFDSQSYTKYRYLVHEKIFLAINWTISSDRKVLYGLGAAHNYVTTEFDGNNTESKWDEPS